MSADERELWRLKEQGDCEARNRLIESYMPLVYYLAHRRRRLTGSELNELISAGAIGLLHAVERFDPGMGFKFSTYATRRIDGAMLDQLRQEAPISRSTALVKRKIAAARTQVESRVGRRAREQEVVRELGVEPTQYRAWERECVRAEVELSDQLVAPPAEDDREHDSEWVRGALGRLRPSHQKVIALAFYEGLSGKEIAGILGVSESRVSQLRARALAELKLASPLAMAS
jgi:RNA polymerase sigma factor for flagellar operon FliA